MFWPDYQLGCLVRGLARGPLTTGVRGISAASEVGEARESGSRDSQVVRCGPKGRATTKEICRHPMHRVTPTAVLRPTSLGREMGGPGEGGRSALVLASPSDNVRSAIRVATVVQSGNLIATTAIFCRPLRDEGGSGRPFSPYCAFGSSKVRRRTAVSNWARETARRARSERAKGHVAATSLRPSGITPLAETPRSARGRPAKSRLRGLLVPTLVKAICRSPRSIVVTGIGSVMLAEQAT